MSIRTALFVGLIVTVMASCTGDLFSPEEGPLSLSPDSMVLLLEDLGVFTVTYEGSGRSVEPRSVDWTSYGSAIAFVNPLGEVLALDTGTTAIVARKESSRGLATVTVIQLDLDGVSAGRLHSCGWVEDGPAYCWGLDNHGQLGGGEATDECGDEPCHFRAIPVTGGLRYSAVAAGGEHSCGLTGGLAYCWGRNLEGQLGIGAEDDGTSSPTRAVTQELFSQLALGRNHSCALTDDGRAFCWGENGAGQLGTGVAEAAPTPRPVAGDLRFAMLSAGLRHTCGVTMEGAAYCWGGNEHRQLGIGSSRDAAEPTRVAGGHAFVTISAGDEHTCALEADGAAYCWGDNSQSQLGDGSRATRGTPTRVDDRYSFDEIAAGGAHTCGVAPDGLSYCWGWNGYRQIGDNAGRPRRSRPNKVHSDVQLADLNAGWLHSCATAGDGRIRCWGYNGAGQLGRTNPRRITDVISGCPAEEQQRCSAVPVPIFGSR